jgi:P4 family phage/plasmid primase-like protien
MYLQLGWEPLPVARGKKHPVVKGFSGWNGASPTLDDIQRWIEDAYLPKDNVALRMPPGVIGIDVDAYDGKEGAASYANLIESYGPLPATWSSSSRGVGLAGIYFFRTPLEVIFRGAPAPGIEIIQRHHRVAMVEPSHHPKSGGMYCWRDPTGALVAEGSVPSVDDLPELPEAWVEGLLQRARPSSAHRSSRPVSLGELNAFLEGHVDASDAAAFDRVCGRFEKWSESRHDGLVAFACAAFREASAGHCTGQFAFDAVLRWWLAVMDDKARRGSLKRPSSEFLAALTWAVGAVMAGDCEGHRVSLPRTDLGNARRLVSVHGWEVRYAPSLGVWFVWDGVRWVEDTSGKVHRLARQVVDSLLDEAKGLDREEDRKQVVAHWTRSQQASRLDAMVGIARFEAGIPVSIEALDTDPFLLNVANGTLDLRTGELRAARPDDLLTKLVPVAWDADAQAPRWEQFLGEVFAGHPEVIPFLQAYVGYCLTGDVSEQVLLFAHGTGSNGKSVLIETLRRVFGDYAIALDPRILMSGAYEQHPTGLTDLRGARLAVTTELPQQARLNETLIKQLTGGDAIRARRMRRDYFEFRPTHKLITVGNHHPQIVGTDDAIWRRILLVPFDATFTGDRQDRRLSQHLARELPGILRWAMEGTLLWRQHGLQVPEVVRAATNDYRQDEDHIGQFLAECTAPDSKGVVLASGLRSRYEEWCAAQGEQSWNAKRVGKQLTARGYRSTKNGTARWRGLRLLSDPDHRGPSCG